ncbi:hypothetical protein DN752_00090 [Echinicola strongylocentroti]|uniref:Uncharacterized protein n=1 Tax=Echinicola strongylocentroti TaxID=1795355 RepID=A0A2Z4ID53_9BACT|nr:hypothetical protein [Echinicola strongylocentroti]AWW28667.1 hypothetical protein DN752_00090 [Echinicola strongylocentroti]
MRKNLLYLLLLVFAACGQESLEPADLGLDYMPVEASRFWTYSVDETVYFGEGDTESSSFYYRDIIADSYIGKEGELVYQVTREKSFDQIAWQDHSVYTLQIKQQALLKSKNNLLTVPLVFPPKEDKSWDGNVYNTQNEDLYSIISLGAYEIGGNTYQSTVKVLQEMEDDEITVRDHRYEIYAKGVGMVEQYLETLTYCSRNDCLGEQIIENGRLSHLKLINNGQY